MKADRGYKEKQCKVTKEMMPLTFVGYVHAGLSRCPLRGLEAMEYRVLTCTREEAVPETCCQDQR